MKFSVIIPVYNVKEYLGECVESVVKQENVEKEIILVDDGSNDSSEKLCDKYGVMYDNVKVIHKENGGSSSARNRGISIATGDYIAFLDSDDLWDDREALCKIERKILETHAELIVMGVTSLYCRNNKKIVKSMSINNKISGNTDLYYESVKNRNFISAPWDKIIKRNLFLEHDLYFKEGITSEDFDWCARLLLLKPQMALLDEHFLVHRLGRGGSIQNVKVSEKTVDGLMTALKLCIKHADGNLMKDLDKQIYWGFVAHLYLQTIGNVKVWSNEHQRTNMNYLKEYTWILTYDIIKSVKIARRFFTIFGFDLLSCALAMKLRMVRFKRR